MPTFDSEQLARKCVEIIDAKNATDIVAMDLRKVSSFTDFFVVATGTSEPHLKALADDLDVRLKREHETRPLAVDGFPLSQWIVVDYGSVVVHLFHASKREIYQLEDLWGDAPRLKI